MAQSKTRKRTNPPSPKRSPGRPAAGRDGNTKEELLLAAIDAFGAYGFDGVSLSQISGKAGTDIGLTRYYFGSKEDLWRAAINHLAANLGQEIDDVIQMSQGSAAEDMKAVIRWFVDMSARWPQLSRIIVFDGNEEDGRGRHVATALVKPFYTLMSDLIDRSKKEGAIADVPTRTLFFLITHGGSFPMALPALTNQFPGGDINSTKSLNAHADAIIKLVFADQ